MGAPSLVSADTWRTIKMASISGVPDSVLAERFGVNVKAIASRRWDDEEWKAIRALIPTLKPSPPKIDKKELEAVIETNLQEIGERNALRLADFAERQIKTSIEEGLVSAPVGWAELKTANEILRKATGQDKEQASVSLNLFNQAQGGGFFGDPGPVIEAVVETQQDDFC